MKKQGFSLIETLIILGIIGILMTAAVTTIRPFDKGVRYLYTNAAISLDRAFYNAMNTGGMASPFSTNSGNNEEEEEDGNSSDNGAKLLCGALTRYINPVDARAACKDDRLVDPMANSFPDDKIQFVAVNGMRFYTSRKITGTVDGAPYEFYLVFVDVNGEKGLGSAEYIPDGATDNRGRRIPPKTPDIFAFAALPMGRIIPIGAPEVDTKFMTTRLFFISSENTRRFSGIPKSYVQSKADAWNYYVNGSTTSGLVSENEAHTFNDVVRQIIREKYSNSLIYRNVTYDTLTRDENFVALEECDENNLQEGEFCSQRPNNIPNCYRTINADNFEEAINACKLHIDNYAF